MQDNNDKYRILIDGEKVDLQLNDLSEADIIRKESGEYHIIAENQSIAIEVIEVNLNDKVLILDIEGHIHKVQIQDATDMIIASLGLQVQSSNKVNNIVSPMPGRILDVLVRPGQEIEEGQPLLILEAMKMENIIKSPNAGVIAEVQIEAGDTVNKGAMLLNLE